MTTYPKTKNVFKRDFGTKKLIHGEFSTKEFEYLALNKWIMTEKVDGTNIRLQFNDNIADFKGRTDAAQIPGQLAVRLAEIVAKSHDAIIEEFGPAAVCLYGEGYGGKIQKGSKYRQDQDFVLFAVNIDGHWKPRHVVETVANMLDLDIVPIISTGNLWDAVDLVQKGIESTWGPFEAEGLICYPDVEMKNCYGERIITKVKSRDFRD